MTDWTPDRVRDRLTEAADVLKRLPAERVQGYFNLWPEVVHDFADQVGRMPEPMRLPPPPPAAHFIPLASPLSAVKTNASVPTGNLVLVSLAVAT